MSQLPRLTPTYRSMNLPAQAAGGRNAGDITVGVDAVAIDRPVVAEEGIELVRRVEIG